MTLREEISLKRIKILTETTCCICGFLVDVNASSEKNWLSFAVEHEHLFLRNVYTIDDLKMMDIDTVEKYSEKFERFLNLFPVVEAALEDEIEPDEFKQFIEEDLNNMYMHIEKVKEYVDSTPVNKNLFVRLITLIKY